MCKLFYIMVCRFCLFRVYNVNIMIVHIFFMMSWYPVSIKYNDKLTLLHTLIIAHYIKKLIPCTVHINSWQFLKLAPRVYYIIAVYKKIRYWICLLLRLRSFILSIIIASTARGCYISSHFIRGFSFRHLTSFIITPAVSKVRLCQYSVDFICSNPFIRYRSCCFFWCENYIFISSHWIKHAVNVCIIFDFIPRHIKTWTVRTEYWICWISCISLGFISDLFNNLICIMTRSVARHFKS